MELHPEHVPGGNLLCTMPHIQTERAKPNQRSRCWCFSMDDNVLYLQKEWEENALEWKIVFEDVLLISFYTVFSFLTIFCSIR